MTSAPLPGDAVALVAELSQTFGDTTATALDTRIDFLDWTVRDLVAHLGAVYAYATANINAASTEPTRPGAEAKALDGAAITGWFAERRQVLLDTFADAPPDRVSWSHAGIVTAGWWHRRMLHETLVHLWDASAVTGHTIDIDGEVASDGIEEYFDTSLRVSSSRAERTYPADTLHLHRTDGPGEWMLARGANANEVIVTHEHGKGAAAVRGSGLSLLAWIWGRPVDDVEIFGDPDVARAWQALAP